eukprot:360688-Chlamydomonas_euryale.AAC.3
MDRPERVPDDLPGGCPPRVRGSRLRHVCVWGGGREEGLGDAGASPDARAWLVGRRKGKLARDAGAPRDRPGYIPDGLGPDARAWLVGRRKGNLALTHDTDARVMRDGVTRRSPWSKRA